MLETYKTVRKEASAKLTEKKSVFIASVAPINSEEEAVDYITAIKTKYHDAKHNVYAYVCGDNNEIKRYSDDGEPQGTGGIPILEMITKEEIKNLVVVVTRYFGGILLGTGGLVRAYTAAAKLGIESSDTVIKTLCDVYEIKCNYGDLGKIQNELSNLEYVKIKNIIYEDNVTLIINVEKKYSDNLIKKIKDITSGNVELNNIDVQYNDKNIDGGIN